MSKALPWLLAMLTSLAGSPVLAGSKTGSSGVPDPAVARIVEHSGDIAIHRNGQVSPPESWASLCNGDTVQIQTGARARIAFSSGEVVEKSGPALVIIDVRVPGNGCSLLGKLTAAARALIFGPEGQKGERPMAVRGELAADPEPVAVPRLVRPFDGELLPEASITFIWQPIIGIELWRLSLYDREGLVWQTTTPGSHLTYPAAAERPLEPGREYYWRVEALFGESRLASWSSSFSVATPGHADSIRTAVEEVCAYATDSVAARLLAAEVFFAARMYGQALESLTANREGETNVEIIRRRAQWLARLKDYAGLEDLMPTLLQATLRAPAE